MFYVFFTLWVLWTTYWGWAAWRSTGGAMPIAPPLFYASLLIGAVVFSGWVVWRFLT